MPCIAERGLAVAASRLHLPQRQGQPILFAFAVGLEPMAPSMAHYQKILRQHGFEVAPSHACKHALPWQWMSGKGNCYEFKLVRASGLNDPGDHSKAQNAAVETFFKTIKAGMIWRRTRETRRQAETALAHCS